MNRFLLCSIFLTSVMVFLPAHALKTETQNTAGEFEFKQADGSYASALLLDTAVSGEVNGLVASISLLQRFQNTSDQWLNGRYVFPLPEGASVDSLTITIGERVIKGVVKEKKAAKKVFEKAKRSGKKAALLQQHRPNLFSLAVANIGPRSNIKTEITYVERVDYKDREFSLRLPTTLTPRYIPGVPIAKVIDIEIDKVDHFEIRNNGWAANTTLVPDANAITPPQVHTADLEVGEPGSSHQFSLSLTIDAGMPLESMVSANYSVVEQSAQVGRYMVSLRNGKEAMNSDLVLRWKPAVGMAPKAALFEQNIDGDHYSMIMLVPPQMDIANALPRDVTFIIDSSGSMAGASMPQAKTSLLQALSHLSPSDRFNIIDFDSNFRPLFANSIPVSERSLRQARNMINQLRADGGTEMFGALQYALSRPRSESNLNQIIFITDGSIGNEDQLFKLIHQELGDARLFTVGIGSAPNSYFMRKAAKYGRGSYTYVGANGQASKVMDEFLHKITRPVLRDVKIDLPPDAEFYPPFIPDLYAAEPVVVLTKSKQSLNKINISGTLLGNQWQRSLRHTTDNNATQSADNLDALWARNKIEFLMDKMITGELNEEQAKPLITSLGVTHQLLTRFTSFVAVEKNPSRPPELTAKHKNIANLMPAGSTMAAPQTATPAMLLALVGALMLLLGLAIRSKNYRTVAA